MPRLAWAALMFGSLGIYFYKHDKPVGKAAGFVFFVTMLVAGIMGV